MIKQTKFYTCNEFWKISTKWTTNVGSGTFTINNKH